METYRQVNSTIAKTGNNYEKGRRIVSNVTERPGKKSGKKP